MQALWLYGAGGFAFGLVMAFSFQPFFSLLAGALLLIVLSWLAWRHWKEGESPPVLLLTSFLMLAGLFYGGYTVSNHHSTLIPETAEGASYSFRGTLQTPFQWKGSGLEGILLLTHQEVNGDWLPVKERLLLRVKASEQERLAALTQWPPGQRFRLHASLESPPGPLFPHAFDYQAYLQAQKIFWIGTASPSSLQVLPSSPTLAQPLFALRSLLQQQLTQLYPPQVATLLQGVLLGDRSQLDPDWKENYEVLGIAHLLAISGLHIGTLSAGLLGLLRFLRMSRERSILFVMLFLPFYALLTGFAPSAVRATIMAEVMWLAFLLRRWYDAFNGLGVAMLFLLCWDPHLLFQPGFQFSFIITAGLLLFFSTASAWFNSSHPLLQLSLLTLVAQVFAFPIQIYYFHQFSWLSFFANLLTVPLYTLVIIPLGFLSLLLAPIPLPIAQWLAHAVTLTLQVLAPIIDRLASWTSWHQNYHPPTLFWMLFYYLGIVVLLILWQRRLLVWRRWTSAFVLWLGCLLFFYPAALSSQEVWVTFLDVGQGDATIIESKEWTILIDAGMRSPVYGGDGAEIGVKSRRFDAGRQRLVPYLRSRGIQHLDWVILTHQDMDHIGGFPSVAEKFTVGHLFWNGDLGREGERTEGEDLLYHWLQQHARKHGHQIVEHFQSWQLDEHLSLTIFPPYPSGDNSNERSLAILVTVYDVHYLFTGDMGIAAESWLIKQALPANVNMLHVGHHGSKTSTSLELLERIQPEWAIISVGRSNRYGHPHQEVLQKLQKVKTHVLRTDQHGTIQIRHGGYGVMEMIMMKN